MNNENKSDVGNYILAGVGGIAVVGGIAWWSHIRAVDAAKLAKAEYEENLSTMHGEELSRETNRWLRRLSNDTNEIKDRAEALATIGVMIWMFGISSRS
jgi:hypothetical protein